MQLGKIEFEQGNDDSADNCSACKKALQRRREKAKLEELKQKGRIEI